VAFLVMGGAAVVILVIGVAAVAGLLFLKDYAQHGGPQPRFPNRPWPNDGQPGGPGPVNRPANFPVWLHVDPPAAVPITRAPFDGEKFVRTLPGTVGQVAEGGTGRFLVLTLPQQRQVAVFDVNQATVKLLPAEPDALVAAGMDRLLVVSPSRRTVQRWNLLNLGPQPEQQAQLTANGTVAGVCMGSGSAGPALLYYGEGGADFFDLQALRLLTPGGDNPKLPAMAPGTVRASADGRTFVGREPLGGEPHQMQVIRIEGQQVKVQSVWGVSGSLAIPSPNGGFFYTDTGVHNERMDQVLNGSPGSGMYNPFVPAQRGGFFVHAQRNFIDQSKPSLAFYLPGQTKPFASWDNNPEGVFDGEGSFGFGRDTHLHWVPAADVVIAIPKTNDRLILHRFDLDKELKKAGVNYLFVTSQPTPVAKKGEAYEYSITTRSKRPGVGFQLNDGPPGMAVGADGKLTWPVPRDFAEEEVNVVVTVTSPGADDVVHAFRVAVK
jgi:hypothetical protein